MVLNLYTFHKPDGDHHVTIKCKTEKYTICCTCLLRLVDALCNLFKTMAGYATSVMFWYRHALLIL